MSATQAPQAIRTKTGRRSAAGRRPRDLRDHGRPREGDDVPLALPTRAARAPRLPDRRCGVRRLDARPARPARARLDRRHGGEARRGGVHSVREAALVPPRRFHGRRNLRRGRGGDRGHEDPRLLPRSPAVALRHGRRWPGEGGRDGKRESRRREAVRARHGVGPRARRRAAPVHRRVPAAPHRPLPREDGDRGDPVPPIRQHDARAGVEPELRRVGPDHHGRGLRGRGPRPLLRPGRRTARRGRQPPHAGGRDDGDGAARRRRREDAPGRESRALQGDQPG